MTLHCGGWVGAGNMIKDEGAKDLAAPLDVNRHIRQLYLNGAVLPGLCWVLP